MAGDDPSSTHKAGRIKDARGRAVTQIDPVAMYLLHRHDQGIPYEVLRELTREIGVGRPATNRLELWAAVVAFLCVLLLVGDGLLQLARRTTTFGEFMWRAILFQGVWIVPLALWVTARRNRFHRIRKAMLRHLRCPHCGYDVRGLTADPQDGATVCPECGCAWRLESARPADTSGHSGSTATPVESANDVRKNAGG